MVTTQSFRLLGKPDLKDIICDQVDGENVVFWEDIEQVFPGVKYITNGNTVISIMRDSNRERIRPQCIKYYPGVVLDVVTTTASNSPLEKSVGDSGVSHTDERPSTPTMTLDLDPEMVQRLVSSLTPNVQAQLRELTNKLTRNFQLSIQVVEPMEKNEQYGQNPSQMDQLRRRIQSVLTRNIELHEEPNPRLFVVLPMLHRSSDGPQETFSNTFRLYFLCDCGEHTMSANSKTSQHIHFAKHEGYDIIRPNEFFQSYGPYVLAILKMLKFGISVAGITVPAISDLVSSDENSQLAADQQLLAGTIDSGMDLVMEYIEKVLQGKGEVTTVAEKQVENGDALENEDLRQLEVFLEKKGNMLGNLYRTITTEGHAKWVCIDHYRERHQEKSSKAFHDTIYGLDGSFYEDIGRAKVVLSSRADADTFYLTLEKATSVYYLEVGLNWKSTHNDLKRLRDTLAKTNVGVLGLDLHNHDGSESDRPDLTKHFDPIFDIMRHPSIQSVTLTRTPVDFIKRSSLLSSNHVFNNLRRLGIHLSSKGPDVLAYKNLLTNAPNLAFLVVGGELSYFLELYSAIAEQQTFTITSSRRSLRILPLTNKPLQPTTPLLDLAHLLKVHGERIEIMELWGGVCDETTVADFARATENVSRLKDLTLWGSANLGEKCINDLASIVARSKLHRLDIDLDTEEERVQILESIQWEYIRQLEIGMDDGCIGMGPLKALVDGIKSFSGKALLEHFVYLHNYDTSELSIAQERLLGSFLALTSLEHLELDAKLTSKQLQSLIESANVSQLRELAVMGEGFVPNEVDAILNRLQRAAELRKVRLSGSKITEEQKERMKGKGITLDNAKMR
ncbi:hypothetical protein BGX34_001493 [Mortierella sp. NVP85]|nr:hypothetical protein BGX34_001493 [Mortierella sp. NVP85]